MGFTLLCCATASLVALVCYRFFGPMMGDSWRYLVLAKNIASGNGFTASNAPPFVPEVFRAPFYPAWLGSLLALGFSAPGVVAAQVLLYLASIVFVMRTALLLHGDALAARVAGALLAVHVPVIRWMVQLGTEAVLLPLMTACVYLVARHICTPEAPRGRHAGALGVVLAAVFLTRTDYVLLAVALPPALVWKLRRSARGLRKATLVALIAGVAVGTWSSRNLLAIPQSFKPLGLGGGMALFVRAVELTTPDESERERSVQTNPDIRTLHDSADLEAMVRADAALTREATAIIRRNAGTWLMGSAYKLVFRNWVEHTDPRLPRPVTALAFGASSFLLGLAYAGGAWLWRRSPAVPVLVLAACLVASVHAALITEARYTIPMRPLVVILAAWPLAVALRWLATRFGTGAR